MSAGEPPAVELLNVDKSFGPKRAVIDLNLTVPRGAIYGIIGPNGSGKSTTLRMIARIYHPDHGIISVLGQDATSGEAANDRIGYLPEERGLYRKMRVGELLAFFAALKGVHKSGPQIRSWLGRLGLGDCENKRVEVLSKGMAQRVQFIAAVLHRPELLILDEPFSGLDPVNMEVLKDAVVDLRREGATILFSTHDMDVAEKMCDFIFMIHQGRSVLDGSLASIRERYGSDIVRLRLGEGGVLLERLPGVARVNDFGRLKELRLEAGADPQRLLHALAAQTRIEHFELAQPRLHDIFVRIAGGTTGAPKEARSDA